MPSAHLNAAQVRAAHALNAADQIERLKGKDEPDAVARFTSLVTRSGLLPALAFALERNDKGAPKRPAFQRAAEAVAEHLAASPLHGNLVGPDATGDSLLRTLFTKDSLHLRRCHTEALEYLSYLKRFCR